MFGPHGYENVVFDGDSTRRSALLFNELFVTIEKILPSNSLVDEVAKSLHSVGYKIVRKNFQRKTKQDL